MFKYVSALRLFVFAIIFAIAGNIAAFSAVDYFLKLDEKDVRKGKSNNNGRCKLDNLSSGNYTLSLSNASLRKFAGEGSPSGIAVEEEGVSEKPSKTKKVSSDNGSSSSNITIDEAGTQKRKPAASSNRAMTSHLYIKVLSNGKEIAGKRVSVGDLNRDGMLDLAFTLNAVQDNDVADESISSSATSHKWSLEVRVDRIEMK